MSDLLSKLAHLQQVSSALADTQGETEAKPEASVSALQDGLDRLRKLAQTLEGQDAKHDQDAKHNAAKRPSTDILNQAAKALERSGKKPEHREEHGEPAHMDAPAEVKREQPPSMFDIAAARL